VKSGPSYVCLFPFLLLTYIAYFSTLKTPICRGKTIDNRKKSEKSIYLSFFPGVCGGLEYPLTPSTSLWFYSVDVEGEEKKRASPSAVLFSTVHTHHVNEKNPKPSLSELYLSPWLLKKTSVVPMWDGKSGLHWHQPCGCFGAGAHTAVGYRRLLSSINVASM
jgi:hypothetical protein